MDQDQTNSPHHSKIEELKEEEMKIDDEINAMYKSSDKDR